MHKEQQKRNPISKVIHAFLSFLITALSKLRGAFCVEGFDPAKLTPPRLTLGEYLQQRGVWVTEKEIHNIANTARCITISMGLPHMQKDNVGIYPKEVLDRAYLWIGVGNARRTLNEYIKYDLKIKISNGTRQELLSRALRLMHFYGRSIRRRNVHNKAELTFPKALLDEACEYLCNESNI